jgi:putative redox protein
METKVTLGYKSDEEYFSINNAGNRLEIDMLPASEKKALSPTELLLSGVVACAAVDIVAMIKKRRKQFINIEGVATGTRREEFPRKFTHINIHYTITSPDLKEEEAEKLITLAVEKYCSVAASINESIQLTHSFSIVTQ